MLRGKRLAWAALAVVIVVLVGSGTAYWLHKRHQREASARSCAQSRARESTIAKLNSTASPRVAVIGDSYAEGVALPSPADAFPFLTGFHVTVFAHAGAGYTVQGICGDGIYSQESGLVAAMRPAVTVVEGGLNDIRGSDPTAAAVALFSRLPGKIIVVGPVAAPSLDGAKLAAVDAELRTAASKYHAVFVSVLHAIPAADFASDRLHPNQAGQRIIAGLVRVKVASALR